MKVTIAYTDTCLPDYIRGDSRPWVVVYPTEQGYTSRELREAILSEFRQGATGGNDPILSDFIASELDQKRADQFYGKLLPACLNREIKYRGKKNKWDKAWGDIEEREESPVLHIVFNIEE
jgi:hypothetical protein